MRRLSSAIGMALALMAAPAVAQTVAVTNVTLALGDGSDPIANGTVVMRDGRIVAAGQGVVIPAGAERIDGRGQVGCAWYNFGLFAAWPDRTGDWRRGRRRCSERQEPVQRGDRYRTGDQPVHHHNRREPHRGRHARDRRATGGTVDLRRAGRGDRSWQST
jgi:hypothetical protein